jgi:hypothetical protein
VLCFYFKCIEDLEKNMKKIITILILTACCVGLGHAQQKVPVGLYKAMNDYLKEGNSLKRSLGYEGLDTTIQVTEIEIGIPIENFIFKEVVRKGHYDSINIEDPVMSLVEPSGFWEFYIKARGEYLCAVQFYNKHGNWEWASTGGVDDWPKVRSAYPEYSGINPIIIKTGRGQYIHFPAINEHNLTLMLNKTMMAMYKNDWNTLKDSKDRNEDEFQKIDGLLSTTTASYKSLCDSRRVFQLFKDAAKRAKESKPILPGGGK